MTKIDLNALTLSELKQLERDVARAIATYELRRVAEAKAEVEELARKLGFKLAELVEAPGGKKVSSTAPKYRNPENPEQTWTGHGRQPKWIKEALASGKSLDEFAI